MSELNTFRAEKDEFFGSDPHSPLTRDQKKDFQGLHYFPENDALRLEVRVEEFKPKQSFEMQTSTGDVQIYEKLGKFYFEVDGVEADLTIYQNQHGFFPAFCGYTSWQRNVPCGQVS